MAVVSERLEITDAFSAVFQRFNTMANRISSSLERIDNNLDQYINTNNRARQSTRDHGEQARKTSTDMTALAGTIGKLVAAFGGMAAIKGLVNLSDELTQTQARLDAINDGLQTSEQLNKMIFASAQNARGSYLDMAQNVAALKAQTGDVFKSTAEAVRFTELLNKQFSISGTSASGVASTMYNLTQALATGVLRGNDLQMVLSNSPALVQRISQYMGITVGELRELASQGKITADIVKNAIMSAGDDIDAQFNKMPMTFGQAMQKVKNTAIMGFQPVGQAIANAINSPEFDQAISAISQGILAVTLVGLKGFEALGRVAKFASDNFKTIAPILGIILAAVVAYNAAVAISTGIEAAHAAVTALITGAKTAYSLAVAVATGNQVAFNAALQACPIVWIIDAIVAAIAVVVALIMVFHNLAQTGHTVFGDVAGVVLGCFAVIQNALAIVANGFISAAEWIANAWNTGVYNIQMAFYNFVLAVANGLNNIISAIDQAVTAIVNAWNTGIYNIQMAIYNFVVSTAEGFNSVIDAADGAATALANAFVSGANIAIGAIDGIIEALNNIPGISIGTIGKIGNVGSVISGRINVGAIKAPTAPQNVGSVISTRIDTSGMTAPTKAGQVSFGRFETQSFGDAFKSGFDQGSAWGDSVQNDLMSGFNGIKEQFNNLMGGSSLGDIASGMDGLGEAAGAGAGGSGSGGGKGKTNVGTVDKVKDVTLSDEDLKIYKDLAEQRYMANVELQTLAPNISVSIPESAAKNLTSEDVANKLKVMLIEQMASHTAVSHAR